MEGAHDAEAFESAPVQVGHHDIGRTRGPCDTANDEITKAKFEIGISELGPVGSDGLAMERLHHDVSQGSVPTVVCHF